MSDAETLWFTAGHRPTPTARAERAGVELWRLYDREQRAFWCELYDDTAIGAGWDVRVMADAEPLYCQRCAHRAGAEVVARALRQDAMRAGCTAALRDGPP